MIKLNPNERLVIETGINHYKVMEPGLIWLKPWERVVTMFSVAPTGCSLRYEGVRTAEEIPIDITIQVLYRIDPDLFNDELLTKIQGLNEGGWQNILKWRTESVLRQLVVAYSWHDLGRQTVCQRLQRHITQTLADTLKGVGLNIMAIHIIKTELPANLQDTIIRAERDGVEARGRAAILKEYLTIFGQNQSQAMKQIVQWELLNMLQKKGNPQILLTTSSLDLDDSLRKADEVNSIFQLGLPWPQEGQRVS